jgi:23S rRNA (pseudouridine1915-N3)-methyltransferase
MHLHIVTIGTPRQQFVRDGVAEFVKRARGLADVTLTHLTEPKPGAAGDKELVQKILAATKRTTLVLLDERGKEYTSVQFAQYLEKKDAQGVHLTFLIGGPDGHISAVRSLPHESLALSKLTLPHEMALLFFAETLYRSLSITKGHPYHRN